MSAKSWIIERLRTSLGDRATSWLHALRYYWVLHTTKANEVDMLLIPDLVRKGDVVADVGANSADWTWRLSRQVGRRGRVLAFEADPYYAEVTRKVIILLGLKNVTFFSYGLSDEAGTASLQVRTPDNERVVGTGRIIDSTGMSEIDEYRTVPVQLLPLDEVPEVKPLADSIRLIKCDVEGHELNVFRGAERTLNQSRPIVIVEVRHMDYQADNEDQILAFFEDLDYNCYVVGSDGRTLLPAQFETDTAISARPNRIMIPKEKAIPNERRT